MSSTSSNSQSTSGSIFSRTSADSKSSTSRSSLHWKRFRKHVLAPHHIRVLDATNSENIPEAIITWIEANRNNTARFQKQRRQFRKQVLCGRGFSGSTVFPHEVLPPNDAQPFLTRCMLPKLSQDALPERMIGKNGAAVQETALPSVRPALACGFSASAFAPKEVRSMPSHLAATGTTIHFDTGSISSDSKIYSPFLTFERVFSQEEYGQETAANQCAVDGAWSVRSLQMLFALASGEGTYDTFQKPVAFTCSIDNEIAVINYHWVDHAQTYCMSPVVRFALAKDDHFDQFLIWIEAIGQWALNYLLPEIKKAIALVNELVAAPLTLSNSLKKLQNPKQQEKDHLVTDLKLTYDNIPWRYETDEFSPVSSSTASWGSPMINEAVFAKFEIPIMQQPRFARGPGSVCSESNIGRTVRFTSSTPDNALTTITKPQPPAKRTPDEPASTGTPDQNLELVMQKRLGHAMDEISDLQSQMANLKQEISGSTVCLQNELSDLRKTMTCVVRKEKLSFQQRPPIRVSSPDRKTFLQSERHVSIQKDITVVTTPTDPQASLANWSSPRSATTRKRSGLQNVLSLDTAVETVSSCHVQHSTVTKSTVSELQRPSVETKIENIQSSVTVRSPVVFDAHERDHEQDLEPLVEVAVRDSNSILSQVAATHILSTLVPSVILRVLLLGFLLDFCMMNLNGGSGVSLTEYFTQIAA